VSASNAEIDAFLQSELARRGLDEVTAVEAASWLDAAGLLADSRHRPGLPLRNLLRAGVIRSGEQRPPRKYGRRFIVRRSRRPVPPDRSRASPDDEVSDESHDGVGHSSAYASSTSSSGSVSAIASRIASSS
jgi:hypothetical protein